MMEIPRMSCYVALQRSQAQKPIQQYPVTLDDCPTVYHNSNPRPCSHGYLIRRRSPIDGRMVLLVNVTLNQYRLASRTDC